MSEDMLCNYVDMRQKSMSLNEADEIAVGLNRVPQWHWWVSATGVLSGRLLCSLRNTLNQRSLNRL